MLALVAFGVLTAAAEQTWAQGILFAVLGLLALSAPPGRKLPSHWGWLAFAFVFASASSFLPLSWFEMPEWRRGLEKLGVDTGKFQVIQASQALEFFVMQVLALSGGLWLAGRRFEGGRTTTWPLAFSVMVALLAVLARIFSRELSELGSDGHFGFFPNRNHTATLLSMGAVVSLGGIVQSLRDKCHGALAVAVIAGLTCVAALLSWSISRAGPALLAVGCLLFLVLLPGGYLGRNSRRVLWLLALAVGGSFLLTENRLKDRVSDSMSVLTKAASQDAEPSVGSLPVDPRLPIWRDALDMTGDAPWTGHGIGQFAAVFPQYRLRASYANEADSVHPESDWLWLAAEAGWPAVSLLAVLCAGCFVHSLKGIRHGRARAIRLACLVAAFLVGVHGLVDVPGHRVPLAWAAAFLFALSLPAGTDEAGGGESPWWGRSLGVLLTGLGLWLLFPEMTGRNVPAASVARSARTEVLELCRRDEELQKRAASEGRAYQPLPEDDLLEQSLEILASALPRVPLNRDLYHLQGRVGLHFDDKQALVERAFAVELALDPHWVEAPVRQGSALFHVDRNRALNSFGVALARAEALRRIDPETRFTDTWIIQSASQLAPRDTSWKLEVERLAAGVRGKQ